MTKESLKDLEIFVKSLQGVNFHGMDKEEERKRALKLIDPLNKSKGPLNELLDKFIGSYEMRCEGAYREGMYRFEESGKFHDKYTSSDWEWWKIGCSLSLMIGQVGTLANFFSYTSELDFNILARLSEAEKRMRNLRSKMMKCKE